MSLVYQNGSSVLSSGNLGEPLIGDYSVKLPDGSYVYGQWIHGIAPEDANQFGRLRRFPNGDIWDNIVSRDCLGVSIASELRVGNNTHPCYRYANGNVLYCQSLTPAGQPEGSGLMTTTTGSTYSGIWVRGQLHGAVLRTDNNSDKIEYQCINGVPQVQSGLIFHPNGDVFTASWDKNKDIWTPIHRLNSECHPIDQLSPCSSSPTPWSCVICHTRIRKVLFLPCHHFLCCIHCSSDITQCLRCQHVITTMIPVFT
jgi:hypothetical protein